MKKVLYIIFIFSLITSPIFSQTASELFRQAVTFYTQGEYSKSLEVLKKINQAK